MTEFIRKIYIVLDKREYQGLYAWSVFSLVVIGITCFITFAITNNNPSEHPTLPTPTISDNTIYRTASIEQKPIPEKKGLKNGTVLAKNNLDLKGLGTLKIDNGTSNDSVVKFITTETGRLVYFVYISANSSYTIENISDNSYKVLFSSGTNWDGKVFTKNRSNQSFDDKIDYITYTYSDSEYEHTKYTTYNLTLNPVIGGTAQTSEIDKNIFDGYQ